ncbi:AlpA family transcriptional regulator [uncultured Paracoccus sp.]|uniref:helix-turn-helix transcriptional regulator n=1 Tax=uncultured Paracoccus sp. TaxID=189685 RepID=UPI00262C9085|nr:AlpA family phage regulatory protein [uncultured Paracoccus sp.]
MSALQPHAECLVRVSTLVEMLQRSRANIYRDIQRGCFPKPLKQGSSSRWRMSEIMEYIEHCSQAHFGEGE